MLDYFTKYTINELVIGSLFIFFVFYFLQSYNINLLQFTLIICAVITIGYITIQKDDEIKNLQTNILSDNSQISTSKSKSLLKFINKIKYFKLYNSPLYDSLLNKINDYIKLQKFIHVHTVEKYKLYPNKILQENLAFQRNDIITTFLSFEHTLDDRITSVYKLQELTEELSFILSKSKLI